jgi:hypothetical protein
MKHPLEYYDRINIRIDGVNLKAYRIGSYLYVIQYKYGFRVCKSNKSSIVKCYFAKIQDALDFAEWLIEKYGKYFCIWDDYPDVDITSLAKWTVEDGINLHEMLRKLDDAPKISSLDDVNAAYFEAKKYAEDKWKSRFGAYC